MSGYAGQDPEETLPGSAWAGLFRDFENLVGAMPAVLTQADACLLEAEAVFSAAEVALDEQWERMNAAEDAHAPPPMPAALKIRGNDWMYTSIPQPSIMRRAGGSETYGAEEVEILRTRPCMQRTFGGSEGERQPDHSRISPDKMAQARADTIVAAWDEWQAGLQAAREAVDLPRLEAEREALFSRRNAALALARDTPAKTLVGLAVKARTARNMEAGIDLRRAACRKDDDAVEGFFYTLAADVLGIAAPLAAGAQPEAATASLADQILTCWRDYGTDIDMGDEEENEATRALNKRRSDLIDAAEALPATRENVPAKALALAWLEYVDLWRNGDARRLHRRWPPRPRHRHGRLRPADDGVLSVADVLTFHARRPAPSISRSDVLDGPSLRLELEQAAQAALDQAERLIALLDRMDGEPDDEDGGDAELSLGAPEGHASQVIWLRGSDFDLETTSENRA